MRTLRSAKKTVRFAEELNTTSEQFDERLRRKRPSKPRNKRNTTSYSTNSSGGIIPASEVRLVKWTKSRQKAFLIAYQIYRPHTAPYSQRLGQYQKMINYVNKFDRAIPPVTGVKSSSKKLRDILDMYSRYFPHYKNLQIPKHVDKNLPIEQQAYIVNHLLENDQPNRLEHHIKEEIPSESEEESEEEESSEEESEEEESEEEQIPLPTKTAEVGGTRRGVKSLLARASQARERERSYTPLPGITIDSITVNGHQYHARMLPSPTVKEESEEEEESIKRDSQEHKEIMDAFKETLQELKQMNSVLRSIQTALSQR